MDKFKKNTTLFLFCELWKHIDKKRKIQFTCLVPIMFIAGIFEAINIGLLMPFIGALAKPSVTYDLAIERFPTAAILWLDSPDKLLNVIGICFIFITIISVLTRVFLIYWQTKISYGVGAELSINIFRNILFQPYEVHISRNSSEVISVISNKASQVVVNVIYPALNIITAFFISIVIIFTLVYLNPSSAILAIFGFGSLYALIIIFTKRKVSTDSEQVREEMNRVVKLVQEGIGGVRDILIDRTQKVYINSFSVAERALRNSLANLQLISTMPRLTIESSAMILIVILALMISNKTNDFEATLPLLGVIALGGQKLMPLLNQLYVGWASIAGSKSVTMEVIKFLNQKGDEEIGDLDHQPFLFNDVLELKNVSYSYSSSNKNILNNVNLSIKKGEIIGIVGESGSGKSTLLDLILGLLDPVEGQIYVDGCSIANLREKYLWQSKVAHVPQSVFLSDASFAENIAFGIPAENINHHRVMAAAKLAHISDFIESKPESYSSNVGERGVQLSGGQRQRIGIARAFYKTSEVIVFDEATSALDEYTEKQIFQSIGLLPSTATVLIVSHRPQTLKNCSRIIELSNGRLLNK